MNAFTMFETLSYSFVTDLQRVNVIRGEATHCDYAFDSSTFMIQQEATANRGIAKLVYNASRVRIQYSMFHAPKIFFWEFNQRLKHSHEAMGGNAQEYHNYGKRRLILQTSSATNNTSDLELDLKSGWYAKSPPTFPPASIHRLPGKRSYASSSGWSSSGVRKTHTFTGAIRDNTTLATTIIHLTWDASNPEHTVKAQQRHISPPRKLSSNELESYRERYADAVATWSESNMGRQVGNGECWTLAYDALVAVGRQLSSRGREACMASQSYVHGALIYSFLPAISSLPEPHGGIKEARAARGDIIQLYEAHFKSKDGSQKWAGAPDHTAVIVDVLPNGVLKVVEQNVGGVKRVKEGSYDMSELVKGEVRIYRAVGENWVGRLDPKW